MTKRNPGLPRRPRDAYATPLAAVLPLVPHLINVRTFAEPCCGAGELITALERHDMLCVYRGDIDYGTDVMRTQRSTYSSCDAIITNPPWDRPFLHAILDHLVQFGIQTWLLIDVDWAHTKQSVPYLRWCSTIVPVGRVKWIPNSESVGYDNAAWYRFKLGHTAGIRMHTR